MQELLKCPNCGAPLPSLAPGQVEVCPYCHAETREEPPPPPPPPPQEHRHPRYKSDDDDPVGIPMESGLGGSKVFLVGVGVIVAALLALSGYFLWSKGANKGPSASAATLPAALRSAAPLPAVLTLADLRTARFTDGNQWRAIIAPGMVGTYEAFDVVSNYDWASRIATSWSPGAVLTRVLVARIARDGTVDVSHPYRGGKTQSDVDYFFTAPGAGQMIVGVNDSSSQVPTTGGATPHVAILVRLSASERLQSAEPPFAKPACSLAQAFKAAAKPLARLDATPTPAGLDPGFGATLLNDGIATHWVISYATVTPGTTSIEGHEAIVNAMTCVLERTR
jgi:hypothetical protein